MSHVRWHVAPVSVLVLTGGLLFPSAGHDDTHITCWPAYTLIHFGQILNYNGDRVEQSSSLLQVLLLATLGKATGGNLVSLAKLSSIALGIATVVVLFTLVTRATSRGAGLCAAMIAAASPPIVYWSFSGMETTLVSCTALLMILTTADYVVQDPSGALWKATLSLAAFALVRPETPLLIALLLGSALSVVVLLKRTDRFPVDRMLILQRLRLLLLMFGLVCAGLFAFRLGYFGAPFPQPVTSKFAGVSAHNIVVGLHYIKRHSWNEGPATAVLSIVIAAGVLLAGVSAFRARTLNLHVMLSVLFAVGYFCCVVAAGGDWMEGGRFLVHFLPVAIACLPFGLKDVGGRQWALPVITAAVVALEGGAAIAFASNASTSVPLWAHLPSGADDDGGRYSWFEKHNRINVRDMPLVAHLDEVVRRISIRTDAPVSIASGQMGMVAYHIALRHFGRVRFLDRHGLIERSLTDCPVTRDVPRDSGGLVIGVDRYLASIAALVQTCQVPRPDIIFDIGSSSRDRLEASGYRSVYSQTGDVASAGTRLFGAPVSADAFVGVDVRSFGSLGTLPDKRVYVGR